MPENIKIDLHVHSTKSADALSEIKTLATQARKIGLRGMAVCDHNYIHKTKQKFKGLLVLYGCEVSTDKGHLLILGVDKIPTKNAEKLCEWVEGENGVAIPAHIFTLHKSGMGGTGMEIGTCVEKYNGTDPIHNLIAGMKIKDGTGGSDAHHKGELGLAWTEFEGEIESEEDVLEALRKGKFEGKVSRDPFAFPIAFAERQVGRAKNRKQQKFS